MLQKLQKAPGPDHITNELIKGTSILTKLYNDIITTGIISKQWNESHIILLHKEGDKDDIGKFKPLSLMSNVNKILDENQPIEQAGFRKNYTSTKSNKSGKNVMNIRRHCTSTLKTTPKLLTV